MTHSVPENTTDQLIHRIRSLCCACKFDSRSEATVSAAARKHPRDSDVLLAVAEYREAADIHNRRYRGTRHARAYRRVLELDPKNSRAWENLATVLDIEGHYTEAAHAARKALRLRADPDTVALLSRILAQLGRNSEARRLADRIRRVRSEFARRTAKEVLQGQWDPL